MKKINIDELVEQSIEGLSDQDALDHIGILIDIAGDTRSAVAVDRAFDLLSEMRGRAVAPELQPLIHYFSANAWSVRRCQRSDFDAWAWAQPEVEAEISELRKSMRCNGFALLSVVRQCQIFTNLANQLNFVGRFIESIEYFDRALALADNFAMALGNRGIALGYYARAVYDRGHGVMMMAMAHELLTKATSPGALYDSPYQGDAHDAFAQWAKDIADHVDVQDVWNKVDLHGHSLGRNKREVAYRKWCLAQRLFLNPLNDLGAFEIAGRDVLPPPPFTTKSPRIPLAVGFFNQMKQEFVSARYLYYEGLVADCVHFSDQDVLLYNTLDYSSYSFSIERVRVAFRVAYSILDKIAFFLNHYFDLGHNPTRVSFRSVWYEPKGRQPRPLLNRLTSCQNWPLRGLFMLSRDIFEEGFQSVMEPDAEALKDLRDHLEHKYLQIHESWAKGAYNEERQDSIGLHVDRGEFSSKALRLLKLVRASMIYLSLAIYAEENKRKAGGAEGRMVPMHLGVIQDDWKR